MNALATVKKHNFLMIMSLLLITATYSKQISSMSADDAQETLGLFNELNKHSKFHHLFLSQ